MSGLGSNPWPVLSAALQVALNREWEAIDRAVEAREVTKVEPLLPALLLTISPSPEDTSVKNPAQHCRHDHLFRRRGSCRTLIYRLRTKSTANWKFRLRND